MIVLTIPEATPSGNKYAYSHWRVRHADKRRWAKLLLAAAVASPSSRLVVATTTKQRVTVERFGSRKLDVDNFAGGLKGVLDTLREFGFIVDDSDEWLELVLRQPKKPKGAKPFTTITIEPMPRTRREK